MAAQGRKNADSAIIAALAGGATVTAAAERAGVSQRTIFRRLQDAGFRRQVSDARSAMVSEAVGLLARASGGAAITLAALLKADSEQVRLGAARAIIELGAKLRETEELEQRIAALEALPPMGEVRRWPAAHG